MVKSNKTQITPDVIPGKTCNPRKIQTTRVIKKDTPNKEKKINFPEFKNGIIINSE